MQGSGHEDPLKPIEAHLRGVFANACGDMCSEIKTNCAPFWKQEFVEHGLSVAHTPKESPFMIAITKHLGRVPLTVSANSLVG